jgi:uncharacterized protein (TIGR02271 family)
MPRKGRANVVGVFADRDAARKAVAELKRVGFREDQLGLAAPGEGHEPAPDQATHSKAAEGLGIGAAAGAGVGALWALGILTLGIPGIGPVVAGGALMSLLSSAAGGAAAGALAGGLIGLGIPEEDAAYYENEFKAGRTLVTVAAGRRRSEAQAILRRFGAADRKAAERAASASAAETRGEARAAGGQTMQVREEQLGHKRPETTGEVDVRKEVVAEHQTVNVPVAHDEVIVERRRVDRPAGEAEVGRAEEVRVPVRSEEVRVEKEPVVKEEVSVRKRPVTEDEPEGGTVRKERVHVEKKGDVNVQERHARKHG